MLAAFVVAAVYGFARSAFRRTRSSVAGDGFFDVVDDFNLGRGSCFDFAEGDEACDFRLAEHFLAVELGHLGVFGILLDLRIARPNLFFAGVLGDTGLLEGVVRSSVDVRLVDDEVVG